MATSPIGCLSPTAEVTRPLETASQSQTSVPSVLTRTSTVLPTRKPTATFAPTHTPLPAQTDLPTIEPGSINTMVDSLYARCKLPCWGSIIPGKTSQSAAKRFLAPLGEWYAGGESLGEVSFQYKNASASIFLLLRHGLVDSINLPPVLTKPYRINRLFNEYGVPEDIQIEVIPYTAELTTWFNLILLYPRQGIFAVLSAEGTPINSIIHICPRNVSPDLYLLASNTYGLNEMNEVVSAVRPHIEFQPLDVLTDIDINQFYEIFRAQSTACVATNVKFQLP
jgi:hypothetical protein